MFVTRYSTCFEVGERAGGCPVLLLIFLSQLQFKSKNPKVEKKLVIEKSGRIYEIGEHTVGEGGEANWLTDCIQV